MPPLLDRLSIAPIHDQALRLALDLALVQFYGFTLVLIRLSGLMIVGPIFGQSVVPANVRILLIVTMALLITPAIHDHANIVFNKLDVNHDGLLTRDEVPDSLAARFESLCARAGRTADDGLPRDEFRISVRAPRTIFDYAWIAAGEFGLGFVLGLGVLTILSGLQLAGDLIDQQTGLSLGQIANPGLDTTGSVTGQFLFTFAVTVLLVMQPSGYHLKMVSALVETFRTIPLGEAVVTVGAVDLLRDLVHQSLALGIRIAAPLLAAMSLIGLTLGFLGHSVPQVNILVVGFPVRAIVSMVVLIASITGIAGAVVDVIPSVIDGLSQAIVAH